MYGAGHVWSSLSYFCISKSLKRASFLPGITFGLLLEISCPYIFGSIYGLCSIDLPIFVPIQKVDVLKSSSVSYLNLFFYKVDLAILKFWNFHLNFRICFFQLLQWKETQFWVGSCWIYKLIWEEPTWVGLWTHEHKVNLHLSVL